MKRRQNNRRRRLIRLLKLIAIPAVILLSYGAIIEPRLIEVTRHEVSIKGLPSELDGLRIVQITDLHTGPLFREGSVRRAIEAAQRCNPDVVVLTGDFVSYGTVGYLGRAMKEMQSLQTPKGVYACLGNHDHWEDPDAVRRELVEVGIKVLVNENVQLRDGLSLAAVDDLMAGKPDLRAAVRNLPEGDAVVLLSHNPTMLPQVAHKPWLVLSGHSHGGQMALPFLGPEKTVMLPGLNQFVRRYEALGVRVRGSRVEAVSIYRYPAGWYTNGKARMYVSRGVGINQAMPLRFGCRPEIACFVLSPL